MDAQQPHPAMAADPPQLELDEDQTRAVGKRSQAQAAPVDRTLMGDFTYGGSNTPSLPAGKTRLAANSPASIGAILGSSPKVDRAARHFHPLQVAKDDEAAGQGVGPLETTQTEPDTPVEHRQSEGPPTPPPI